MGGTQHDAGDRPSAVRAAHSDSKYASLRGEEGLNQVAMPNERSREREGGVQRSRWEPQKPASSRCASLFVRRKEDGGRHAARKNGPRRREKDVSKNRLTRSFSHSRSMSTRRDSCFLSRSLSSVSPLLYSTP